MNHQKDHEETIVLFADGVIYETTMVIEAGHVALRVSVILASCQLADMKSGAHLVWLVQNVVKMVVIVLAESVRCDVSGATVCRALPTEEAGRKMQVLIILW